MQLYWFTTCLLQIACAYALECYQCSYLSNPKDCHTISLCQAYEQCFTQRSGVGVQTTYTLGCKPKDQCHQASSSVIGRSATQTPCYECCASDECNKKLCSSDTIVINKEGACADDPKFDCYTMSASYNVCSHDIAQAKSVCRKFCGLCGVGLIDQWVVSVSNFSSQYNTDSWAAMQVVGQPNVYPQYGDIRGTWAQKIKDAHQYITVTFEENVLVSGIDIYETYHAGGIRQISAVIPNPETGDSDLIPLYTCPDGVIQNIEHSRIFSPSVQNIGQATNTIRIDIDCSLSGTWVEIDAIQLHGYRVGA